MTLIILLLLIVFFVDNSNEHKQLLKQLKDLEYRISTLQPPNVKPQKEAP